MKPVSSIAAIRIAPRKLLHSPTATGTSKPKASPAPATAPVQFPIAERVSSKPGWVISPFDPQATYVDVSGYTSGSKVKDPWTEKIFVVP